MGLKRVFYLAWPMTNFIPVFPLSIVVFPDETLNLHIFEARYIQLINECVEQHKPFGIPVVLNNTLMEFGILMEITEVVKQYDSGELDIRTKGLRVFRILEFIKQLPDKLYSGAIVNYPENQILKIRQNLSDLIIEEVKKMYRLLDFDDRFNLDNTDWSSYDIAHKAGLSQEQEYELLQLFNETQRLEYLRRHLKKMQPVIRELSSLKDRIRMNGHFRNLSSPDAY